MGVCNYDSTAILAEPIKNRSEPELLRACSKIHQHLTERGLKPQLQKLDNECSEALKTFMRSNSVDFQLVPPYDHRQNAAERAIGIWKDHFVAGLASLDPTFPMHLWCRLIEQCTQTLNLMRPSRINPRLSAEAQLNGAFDYNKTPLAPPGTKVLIHETPNRRRTWAVHGVEGYYLGGAKEHCRCYRVYATKTRAERIARTLEFPPHYGKMPALSDAVIRAAIDLCWAIRNPSPSSPIAAIGDKQMDAIQQLSEIFSNATAPATSPPKQTSTPPKPASPPPQETATLPRVPRALSQTKQNMTPLNTATPPLPDKAALPRVPRALYQGPHTIEPDNDKSPPSGPSPIRR
jgi:hypothetical protein